MKFQDVDIIGTLRITGSFQVPYGFGTGSYPQNPTSGSLFLDTSDEKLYVYEGTWEVVGAQVTPPQPYNIEYLVIAGGGGAGPDLTGGGGAGGLLSSSFSVTPDSSFTLTVGAGGSGYTSGDVTEAQDGIDSTISGATITTITAIGGGGGSRVNLNGRDGGSGGGIARGNSYVLSPGSGTPGQGNDGGVDTGSPAGTGGGGAASAGGTATGTGNPSDGGDGGNGKQSNITGTATYFAGGGGGGGYYGSAGAGGLGGGGDGSGGNAQNNQQSGTANTGGGGGGGGQNSTAGAGGGSGVIVLRMPTSNYSGTYTGDSVTVTTSGTDTILIFSGSGTYTA